MKIEIIVDPARPLSLASRVAPAAAVVATNGSQVPRSVSYVLVCPAGLLDFPLILAICSRRTGGGARRRGRGGGRGAGRARRTERLPKSAADLDAEMEVGHCPLQPHIGIDEVYIQDYTASNAPTAATA